MNTTNRSAWYLRRKAGSAQNNNNNSNVSRSFTHTVKTTQEQFVKGAREAEWYEMEFDGSLMYTIKNADDKFAGNASFWRHCAEGRRLEIQLLESADNPVFKGLSIQDKGKLTALVCENNPTPEFIWDERDLPKEVKPEDIESMDDAFELGIEGKFVYHIAPHFVRFVRERDGKVFGKPLPEKEIKLVEKNDK